MENYTPTEWENGDVITSEKLNNIEDGISNNFDCDDALPFNFIFLHTSTEDEVTFTNVSMTASEIIEAKGEGKMVFLNVVDSLRGMERIHSNLDYENLPNFGSDMIPNPYGSDLEAFYVVHDDGSVSIRYQEY